MLGWMIASPRLTQHSYRLPHVVKALQVLQHFRHALGVSFGKGATEAVAYLFQALIPGHGVGRPSALKGKCSQLDGHKDRYLIRDDGQAQECKDANGDCEQGVCRLLKYSRLHEEPQEIAERTALLLGVALD